MKRLNLNALFKRKRNKTDRGNEPAVTNRPSLLSGISDTVDVISPDGLFFPDWRELLEKKRGYIQTNGRRYTRIYQILQHPSQVYMGYLNDLYSIGDVDVSIHVFPGDPDEDVQELTDLLIKLETTLYAADGRQTSKDALIEKSLMDTRDLRDNISLNRDRMFYVSTFISVSALTLEELDRKSEELERLAGRKMMRIGETFLEEDLGLIAASPSGVNPIVENHSNFNLAAGTALFPFDSPELTHPNGTFLGRNWHTGAPVFFNNFIGGNELPAIHMNVFGRTRSGKSTFVKLLISRDACRGIITWVFDPDGEYGDVMDRIGGKEIKLMPGKFCGFNFCDVETDEVEQINHLLSKIEEVKSVLLYMMEQDGRFPLTPEEESLLHQAIQEEYEEKEITDDPDSLWEEDPRVGAVGLRKKEMPTISSIHQRLQSYGKGANRMVTRLIPYLRGSAMGIFDGQTDVSLDQFPAVSFNLKALDTLQKLRPLAMHILQNYTWENFVKRRLHLKKRVVFDEAWLFTKIPQSLNFFEQLARRAAKRNTTLTLATQNIREFTRSDEGKVVLAQAGVTLLFQQQRSDLRAIQELWELPDGQVEFIRRLNVGDALMRMGEQATAIHVEPTPYEEEFVFTTAGEWGVAPKTQTATADEVNEFAETTV
ncbi:hypothetical protein DNHGIG_40030 [Collibacillus ludicampi]|uniref:Helicase HerA central domain-containing protein n=1 Tax=Collibacillus ludicampi TaxID=2771369 RepID=A0AAV4LKY1_9BACL|nr:DUF87 domain-containing protein [Collibacillus ludicampi]GIM48454.1 hypothetical protein DNHGIG_40030 [Collibacillus ludicampi]